MSFELVEIFQTAAIFGGVLGFVYGVYDGIIEIGRNPKEKNIILEGLSSTMTICSCIFIGTVIGTFMGVTFPISVPVALYGLFN